MSARLTSFESFRARTWRDIQRRADVLALSNRAHRLLVGIIHQVLTPYNNGFINLGPATMARLGLTNKANAEKARADLMRAGLLVAMTEGKRGARTCYGLPFLRYEIDPRNRPPEREVTPQNLLPEQEDFPPHREVF